MRCGGKAARAYKENEMRVISGTARGTRLAALPGEEITRPTVDRVKEGIGLLYTSLNYYCHSLNGLLLLVRAVARPHFHFTGRSFFS